MRGSSMKLIRIAAAALALSCAAPAQAGTKYAFEEIVYLTCAEAWELSGKDIDESFEIIRVLARFSLEKRQLAIPDDEKVGEAFGTLVKASCTVDPDDLLFNAVDKAIRRLLG